MNFFTRIRLENIQVKQETGDTLTLSGETNFAGVLKSKNIEIDATPPVDTGITNPVLTYDGSKVLLLPNTGSGGTGNLDNVGGGQGIIFVTGSTTGATADLRTLSGNSSVIIQTTGSTVNITASGSTIPLGSPSDGTYDDGVFPFTQQTKVSDAIDDLNELLIALVPQAAPNLTGQSTNGTFVSGNLSFGVSNLISGYTNVSTAAGNTAVDVNGSYIAFGTRKGLTQNNTTGILNDTVVGDIGGPGIPYEDNAFGDGNAGLIVLELNGNIILSINLTGSTGATTVVTGSTSLSVTAQKAVKFDSGADFNSFIYRTGTFSISTGNMVNGFNYVRVIHSGLTSGDRITNFTEWVYDPDSIAIGISSSQLTNINLTGSRFISGVEYNTGGSIDYSANALNVYKNVYSNSSIAISFPTRTNLGVQSSIAITGSGITSGTTTSLPQLNTGLTNPENTSIDILATLPISSNIVIGNVAPTGQLESNIQILHPFTSKSFTGAVESELGFLFYNITQAVNNEVENFTGEANRLQTRDFTVLLYGNIDSGVYNWDSTQDLVAGNSQHNTGLLVFNGELLYPNAAYLASTYGISNGNFSTIANAPVGNPNYTSASGQRNYYRLFKSNNATTQSTLTFEITHTGSESDFLTNGGTAGTPSSDQVKFEFLIKRSGGATHGWANPFAPSGNPEGIANTLVQTTGSVTTVSCTLSTTPRVAVNDIIIVRLFVASTYSNRISNIAITNI